MAELSVRYAASLFDLSMENGLMSDYLEQVATVRDTLQTQECRSIIEHPRLSYDEKKKFLDNVFAGKIHDDLMGFMHLVTKESSGDVLIASLSTFINMANVQAGRTVVHVTSAAALSDSQMDALSSVLSKKLGKKVDIDPNVDPSLIGGLHIRVDNFLIDHTMKKQLNDLIDSVKRGMAE